MLESFRLKNFKSYKSAILPLAPLTVLIGANASGKSNAIEGLRFIAWLAQGQRLSSIQHQVNSGDQIVRGTVGNLVHGGSRNFGFSCKLDGSRYTDFETTIEVRKDGLHIIEETLTSPLESVPLYILDQRSTDRSTDVGVAYNNFARGGRKPHITCIDQMSIFLQLMSPASLNADHRTSRRLIPAEAQKLEKDLSNILFLDPNPHLMREYSFPADERLRGDGSNLSAVLFNLCGRPTDDIDMNDYPDELDGAAAAPELLELIQSLPEQNIKAIGFIHEPRGGVMVKLVESFGSADHDFDASLLSDGTLRVLSIAAALLSAPQGSMVVVEEIDNGVHPSRAQHLLSSITRIAKARNLRVLMTTHNPALLDALPDESIADVVFCYRNPSDGSSKLLRLSDSDDFPELIAQDTLGGLLTTGVLDRYAKIKTNKEEKRKKALSWLESL